MKNVLRHGREKKKKRLVAAARQQGRRHCKFADQLVSSCPHHILFSWHFVLKLSLLHPASFDYMNCLVCPLATSCGHVAN